MAWSEGTMGAGAGELISILDTYLVANAYWSIYDGSAGTNAKVYRNEDAARASDFYLEVDDNYSGYAIMTLWEGWDAVAHAGTGASVGGSTSYTFRKSAGAYGLAVHDLDFSFVNREMGWHGYCGQVKRFDETKNMPLLICYSYNSTYNPTGGRGYNSNWLLLFDKNGVSRNCEGWGRNYSYNPTKITNGKYFLLEWPVHETTNDELLGFLNGCSCRYAQTEGLSNGDEITDGDSVVWLVVHSTYMSFCRMS